jgi:hypothetical protein
MQKFFFNQSNMAFFREYLAFTNKLEVGLIPGGGVKPQYLEVQEIYKEASKPGD